jgi:Peptidase A4 family
MRSAQWVLAITSAGMLGLAVLGAATPASGRARPAAKTIDTSFMAGYMALPKSGSSTKWVEVHADLVVPSLNCTNTPNGEVYFYSALGGYNEPELEASGIDEKCTNGTPSYQAAYWETPYPSDGSTTEQTFPGVTVSPGDLVDVSLYSNQDLEKISFGIADESNGEHSQQHTTQSSDYPYTYSSAEVVSYGNINSQDTADFGALDVTHAGVVIKVYGKYYPLQDTKLWNTVELAQKGSLTGKLDVVPSAITTTKTSSFTNTWQRPD